MKWIRRLLIVGLGLYLLVGVGLYFWQESLLFHPRVLAADATYGEHPETWVELPDGQRIHALHLRSAPSKGVFLYLHGNVGNNGRSLHQTRSIQQLGYDLFLVDYRGFGKSSGQIAEERHLTEDLQAVYDHLKSQYAEDRIFLLGYSLGTGPASYLAANNAPGGVVLVAPYTSLRAMKNEFFPFFPDFLMKYDLDNARHLAASRAPVTILHGGEDELIPLAMGQQLAAIDPARIRLVELPGVGHRRAILDERFGAAVREMIGRE
ncbi:alpha/beta fold hydrolase [Neolewinella lacunae]|uniref:Alpha/beta fold hydrolase n=1 Tax=Neolewinella lacunae TaxID=1517758 RepID=A0A923PKY2_9BACT|nr:alpha/beta fold hydrolase [Neolewinella lacunae]MBC6993108.1 alpha/beta fold hydrolase [Neolewinella lacunae]MDN3635928.1 alpha/beta fold hydrolase [Neolewinella lacunae]